MLTIGKSELRIFVKGVEVGKGKNKEKRFIFNAQIGSTKNDDGDYLNCYVPVNFSSKVRDELPKLKDGESFDLIVRDAWFKAYKDKEDYTRPILFINKATVVDADEDEDNKKASKTKSKKSSKHDDEDEDDDE